MEADISWVVDGLCWFANDFAATMYECLKVVTRYYDIVCVGSEAFP